MITITLNSFVHRVPDKSFVMGLAAEHGCQLKRIRRSRHWQLSGQEPQLLSLKGELSQQDLQWIITAIDKALPKTTLCLSDILAQTPNITINQLVSETGCSLLEARKAMDEFEDL